MTFADGHEVEHTDNVVRWIAQVRRTAEKLSGAVPEATSSLDMKQNMNTILDSALQDEWVSKLLALRRGEPTIKLLGSVSAYAVAYNIAHDSAGKLAHTDTFFPADAAWNLAVVSVRVAMMEASPEGSCCASTRPSCTALAKETNANNCNAKKRLASAPSKARPLVRKAPL